MAKAAKKKAETAWGGYRTSSYIKRQGRTVDQVTIKSFTTV